MLSISARGSAVSATSYLLDNSPIEDYYAAEGAGEWHGAGAEELGLSGKVNRADFENLAQGYDRSGNAIVRGAGDKHRAGWDCTFSAPKSVSAVWACAEGVQRAEVANAHQRAVDRALEFVQQKALYTRRGAGGTENEHAGMVAAKFLHSTSRNQDPQLHTHAFVMNVATRADGSTGTIESSHLYRWKMAAGAIYRAELASEMQRLGYQVERDGKSFRVSGVPKALETDFSGRRREIEQQLAECGTSSAKASEVAALNTRQSKEVLPADELHRRWQEQGRAHEFAPHNLQSAVPAERTQMPDRAEFLRTMTERASTFTEQQLHAEASIAAQGALGATEVEHWIADLRKSPDLVRLAGKDGQPRFTTREMLELETGLAKNAEARQHETAHKVDGKLVSRAKDAKATLSDEQSRMVDYVCMQTGGVACVQGAAGTGKSFALGVVRDVYESAGFRVRGAALAGKAAAGLEEGSGIKSQTLHSLIKDLSDGKEQLNSRDIVVLDEAGMVGSRQMAELLDKATEAGAKVVLVGDSRQLQPVDAGGAFRALTERLGAAELNDIRRQRESWARDMVMDFAAGRAGAALAALDERGRVHRGTSFVDAINKCVEGWSEHRDPSRPGESLMIAGTRADVAALNSRAREVMREEGALGKDQRIDGRSFAAGDRLLFERNSRILNVQNGTLGTVESIEARGGDHLIRVKTDAGRTVEFTATEYEHFSHGYAVTAHKAQGVTVDHAHVLASDSMSDREWSYVAASRARDETHVYADSSLADDLESKMSRSRQADFSADYEPNPQQHESEMEI